MLHWSEKNCYIIIFIDKETPIGKINFSCNLNLLIQFLNFRGEFDRVAGSSTLKDLRNFNSVERPFERNASTLTSPWFFIPFPLLLLFLNFLLNAAKLLQALFPTKPYTSSIAAHFRIAIDQIVQPWRVQSPIHILIVDRNLIINRNKFPLYFIISSIVNTIK